MPTSMDALAGMRLLLAGDDRAAVSALRSTVGSAGAVAAACTGDPADVAAVVAADPPEAVVALGGNVELLRAGLDPLGLDMGPVVVAVEELVNAGGTFDGVRAAIRVMAEQGGGSIINVASGAGVCAVGSTK